MNLFKRSIGLRMVCDLRVLRLYVYKLRSCSRYYFVGALASLDENRLCNPPICSKLFSAVYMNVGVVLLKANMSWCFLLPFGPIDSWLYVFDCSFGCLRRVVMR